MKLKGHFLLGGTSRKDTIEDFDISYKFHKPQSGILIVYQNGNRHKSAVGITITDSQNQKFHIEFKELPGRSGTEIYLKNLGNSSESVFSGEIAKVMIHYLDNQLGFKSTEKGFVRLS